MKNKLTGKIKLLTILIGLTAIIGSCEYETVRPADYPPSRLYMPAAVRDGGIFWINENPERPDWHPTPGWVSRYKLDQANNKFIVPLGAYRSGIDRSGTVNVDIYQMSDDIITARIEDGSLPGETQLLPPAYLDFPASIQIADGSELGTFNLEIDLNYLIENPDAIFAVGIGISTNDIEVNEEINETIIVIYTEILNPVGD
jgi:hypothetical protein